MVEIKTDEGTYQVQMPEVPLPPPAPENRIIEQESQWFFPAFMGFIIFSGIVIIWIMEKSGR